MQPAILTLCYFLLLPQTGHDAPPAPKPSAPTAASDQGKAIFVARCGKCHDADGNKKLADGTTLLGRLAKSKDPEARLGTRLKVESERHQVFQYIQSIMAQQPK